jgi:glycosyltransferase involved in cell wall biosynthesis
MNEAPEISVIITTFNRARLLERCLASVLTQQSSNFEVIVIDDASNDDTGAVMARLSDPRLRYQRLERNCGAPAKPRNVGLGMARAPLLFVFDSDDTMLPGCLAAFVAAFAANERLGLAWSWKNVLDNAGNVVEIEKRERLLNEPPFPLALSYAPGANGLAFRRAVVERIGGFDEALPRMDDYDFTLRFLAAESWSLDVLPIVTMNVHSDSTDHVSASSRRTLAAREHVLHKHRELFARYPDVYARHLYNVALLRLQVRQDRPGFVRGVLASLRVSPRHARRALTLWRILPGALPTVTLPATGHGRRADLKRNLID